MEEYVFEWNPQKAQANVRKHGVSFEEAVTVFYDDLARLIPDPDGSVLEERFILIGQTMRKKLLIVCHCDGKNESSIRLISARKANRQERRAYEVFKHA